MKRWVVKAMKRRRIAGSPLYELPPIEPHPGMTTVEAHRQLQLAIENRRRIRTELGDVVSAERELAEAEAEVKAAEGQAIDVLVTHDLRRILATS